ncbi:TnsA endonuclease N-terminal domain-containing protein [Thalassospira lucentensis]|uniref:TnsA endonuclease N-terminal domain-containing protein n=1 Tax=Thalassospira lucentensis TaxID=168935 RepID=UPI00294310AC|nr:TnsA endonuclease N-terminal domain-containing protein [Thalassospira lucentensis]WOI08951.1 TnsA endonuclease N-terminal domain-containing protein [Thalassospira lucentensis]
MSKNKGLWVDWLTKYETETQNMRLGKNYSLAESFFEILDDISAETRGAREIRPTDRSITGLLKVAPDQPQIPFELSLERDFAILMTGRRGVFSIEAQPVTIRYLDDLGKERTYTPDFLITRYRHELERPESGLHTMLVEIKYTSDLDGKNQPTLLQKFKHAKQWTEFKGWSFSVFTEKEIRTSELERARELLPYRFLDSDTPVEFAIDLFVQQHKVATIRQITDALHNFSEEQVHTEVLKMLATHQLFADDESRLDADLSIYLL